MSRRTAIPYADAIRWVWENDDTTFMDEEDGAICVSLSLVADIYGRTDDEVRADLRKIMTPRRSA